MENKNKTEKVGIVSYMLVLFFIAVLILIYPQIMMIVGIAVMLSALIVLFLNY